MDVGKATSESSHGYVVNTQTWEGVRTFQYPPAAALSAGAELLTNLWLSISFDDETNPSVLAPIGSFFAVGQFSSSFTRALPAGMDSGSNFYCYFPMPFARRATVQLLSQRASVTTNIQWSIACQPFTDSFANVGYFKTQFRSEIPTTNGLDIVMLDTEGAGHLVGVVESMRGPLNRGYVEGNERFYVDGSHSPAISGTGTEDFYNAGWYFDQGTFTLPTHGNPVHLSDTNYDNTTAYRLFLEDAVPFWKHILAGIEHGPVDDVPINVWTLAYYYYQPTDRAVLTDQLQLGNATSEASHSYTINTPAWSGSQIFTYEWQGNFTGLVLTNTGQAHQGYSRFTMALSPTNAGVILRRQFDQGIASQQADVYANGALVGPWYRAGGNNYHRWRDDDFMIPASYTSGKSSLPIKVQFVSSALDWNEFNYSLYTLEPAATGVTNRARLTGSSWTATAGRSPFVLSFTGATNANYDMWGSTNLVDWTWLRTLVQSGAGSYNFTDSPAEWPRRFYRVVGP